MKAMILVLSPKECAKLLNGDLSVLVRKKFSKDYVGWVYICVTKDNKQELCYVPATETFYCCPKDNIVAKQCDRMGLTFNGNVVARFWCDKVEEIEWDYGSSAKSKYVTRDLDEWELCDKSCLTGKEMIEYLGEENSGYAIHITKLEIFDRPKELNEFNVLQRAKATDCGYLKQCKNCGKIFNRCHLLKPLTRAPQSWCWIEI